MNGQGTYYLYGTSDGGYPTADTGGVDMNTIWGAAPGIYDFPFREYSAAQGRWLSPDPAGLAAVSPADPAYVGTQPLSAADPLGLCNPDDPSAECQQGLQNEKTAEGCLGAEPGSALFQACGGYAGYAGGGAWQHLPDEFDLLTLPVAVDGATWVPGTTSAGPSGDLTENGQVVGSVTSSVQTLGHFEWNAIVGTGSSIFLPISAPSFAGTGDIPMPTPAVPGVMARIQFELESFKTCTQQPLAGVATLANADPRNPAAMALGYTVGAQSDCLKLFPLAALSPDYQGLEPGLVFINPLGPFRPF